jgi:hypothetical protein
LKWCSGPEQRAGPTALQDTSRQAFNDRHGLIFSTRLSAKDWHSSANRSPTHSNKLGVRYRYYVSHAVLQKRKAEAGSVARLPGPEVETLVLDSLRRHLATGNFFGITGHFCDGAGNFSKNNSDDSRATDDERIFDKRNLGAAVS